MSLPHQQGPLTGTYDQSLLAAAPAATKAAKQEGYNVDLLDEGRHRSTPPTVTQDLENGRPKEHYSPVRGAATTRKLPFYKTRRGIIILTVLAVVIVGAVVGGAVGGSVGKKNGDAGGLQPMMSANSTTTSTAPSQGEQSQSATTNGPPGGTQGSAPTSAPPQQPQSAADGSKATIQSLVPALPSQLIPSPTTSVGGNA